MGALSFKIEPNPRESLFGKPETKKTINRLDKFRNNIKSNINVNIIIIYLQIIYKSMGKMLMVIPENN